LRDETDFKVASAVAAMNNARRILVVSDKEAVRSGYLQSLDGVFRNVEFVSDESCAMDAVEQQPFDLVLLDLWKPGTDGLAALRSIKQRRPQTEVVIITGAPTVANAKEAVRLGVYDYVAKPISPQEIICLASCALTQKSWTIHRTSDLAGVSEPASAPSLLTAGARVSRQPPS